MSPESATRPPPKSRPRIDSPRSRTWSVVSRDASSDASTASFPVLAGGILAITGARAPASLRSTSTATRARFESVSPVWRSESGASKSSGMPAASASPRARHSSGPADGVLDDGDEGLGVEGLGDGVDGAGLLHEVLADAVGLRAHQDDGRRRARRRSGAWRGRTGSRSSSASRSRRGPDRSSPAPRASSRGARGLLEPVEGRLPVGGADAPRSRGVRARGSRPCGWSGCRRRRGRGSACVGQRGREDSTCGRGRDRQPVSWKR